MGGSVIDDIFPADPGAYGPAGYEELVRRADPSLLAHVAGLGLSEFGGRGFLDAVARDLASFPGARCAFVGVLEDADGRRVRTIARYRPGRRMDDVVFMVAGTAARHVVGRNVCRILSDEARLPIGDDPTDGVFVGAPLLAPDGSVIGLLGLVGDLETADADRILAAMVLLAGRSSLELERLLEERLADAEHDRLEELLVQRTAELGALREGGEALP